MLQDDLCNIVMIYVTNFKAVWVLFLNQSTPDDMDHMKLHMFWAS
jgi:hypothetical protein